MLYFRFNLIFFLLVIFNLGVDAQATPELSFPENLHGSVKLNISTISNQGKEILGYNALSVFVKNERGDYTSNAVQGQHEIKGNYLLFKSYFPFESGMTYIVRTMGATADSLYSYQSFQIGNKKRAEDAKVVSIYPTASQLPENLLRFYIYFNTPMKKGQALKHIQLIDEGGNIDNHAFMEFKQELWSSDGKRLTLLFDPGRIKRGVSTNRFKGPAILEGNSYKLKISGSWQDVYGQELSVNTIKDFRVVNAYRHHIKVSDWVIAQPKLNSSDTLVINLDRIIDHALIQSMVKIIDVGDNIVNGYWEFLEHEKSLIFIPKKKWKKGKYQIIIDSRLEDVSGNNLQNLLDHIKMDKENNNKTHHYIDFKI